MSIKSDAIELVLAFGRAWEARDPDAIVSMLTESIIYQNIPVPPLHGRDAVRAFITPNLRATSAITWKFLAITADDEGHVVMTERVDTFIFVNGNVVVPVMGIFEIKNSLITGWRDYADIGKYVSDMTAIGRTPGPGIV